ncbi:phosphodiesterase MJ0936 family [Methanobrevibacter ruminantium M1]|uniref:Phosphoesterase n=2 Tax=Methanobrevibacter ruminantium TaxID=83816 RepID=D3E1N4_METRM|nr:phosphodiesterase MJ0936 family [Methanobrevibacter ruminantium M1]
MLIGLISDTHIPDRRMKLPQKVLDAFEDVEMILHAGDITSQSVIDDLEAIAPVHAVEGNMDRVVGEMNLPPSKIVEAEGHKIGIVHGEVYPRGDTQQLYYTALELGVDILVSGHSHVAQLEKIKNVILVNPGSPTNPRLSDPSVAIMEINGNDINFEFVKVGNPVCSALNFFKDKANKE